MQMIRKTTREDKNGLLDVATASGLFEPEQVGELAGMLGDHFDTEEPADVWLTDEENGKPVGVVYAAPERMTDGTWNLYLIAVHPEQQRTGRGKAMLEHIEKILASRGVRVLLVETAGTDDFDYVRLFYSKNGYTEEARIREFYEAGVDKVVFRKALVG